MDQQIKQKWIVALRSGNYPQHTGRLTNFSNNAYCCLGVLRLIIDPGYLRYSNECTSILIEEHRAGLTGEQMANLSLRNDKGDSFSEIADHIEKTY